MCPQVLYQMLPKNVRPKQLMQERVGAAVAVYHAKLVRPSNIYRRRTKLPSGLAEISCRVQKAKGAYDAQLQ